MILKLIAAALVAAAPVTASQPYLIFQNVAGVVQVNCDQGKGTAFRVGKKHFLSVAHVTAMTGCTVEGKPIRVTEQDTANDFSQFDADLPGPILKIDCSGFHAGEWAWSVGYARGAPFQTAIAIYATYAKDSSGKRVLIGPYSVIPGMSGGPVFGRDGVIGTVNAYIRGSQEEGVGISFSRDLRDTSVCSKS